MSGRTPAGTQSSAVSAWWRRRHIVPLLWAAGLLLIWELAVRSGAVPDYLLASPSAAIYRMFSDADSILASLAPTTIAIFAGFASGVLIGIVLALAITSSDIVERVLYPLIIIIETIPKIAFAPLLIVWLGFTIYPKLVLCIIAVFFPVLVDAITGFRSVEQRKYFLAKSMGMSAAQTLFHIKIPSAMPNIFSGLRIGLIASVTVVVVVEYLLGNDGIGFMILQSMENHDTELVFAAVIVTSLLGVILTKVVDVIEYKTMPWVRLRS